MVIKRFSNILGSRHGANPFSRNRSNDGTEDSSPSREETYPEDSPEGNAAKGVKSFCECGTQGDEVLHLPTIVEAAESSPAAAKAAAMTIRKFLSKDNYSRPHVQYNAIMLIRILADNPGASFTRNIDQKFTSTVKELLRNGKDMSVQQIMRETLQALYMEKAYDTNLQTLFAMWSKESGVSISQNTRAGQGQGQGQGQRNGLPRRGQENMPGMVDLRNPRAPPGLPPPVELAARIEEAKTSAKLLQQLVQSTPPNELQDNDLIKEFAERCQNAQRSMQGFMASTNPPPDDDTMQTLIETSEQLSLAASKHQRAILQSRRAGHTASPTPQPAVNTNGNGAPQLPPITQNTGYSSPTAAPSSTFTPNQTHDLQNYAPPPPAPANLLKKALNRRSTGGENGLGWHNAAPPSLRPGGPPPPVKKMSLDTSDDPFDDPPSVYQASTSRNNRISTGPPISNSRPISQEPVSASSYNSDEYDPYRNPATVATVASRPPIPRAPQESWRGEDAGSPTSYAPGYHSTPSYVRRQESSGDNITMQGATTETRDEDDTLAPLPGASTIQEERIQESAGRYGRVSPESQRSSIGSPNPARGLSLRSRIGSLPGQQDAPPIPSAPPVPSAPSGGDVSPIETRSNTGYHGAGMGRGNTNRVDYYDE